MADYPLLAVLSTGKPGVPNTSNFGTIPKLKVSDTLDVTNNITVGGTVDGVDVATLKTDYDTHDGASAYTAHGNDVGGHTHQSAGAQGGQIDHGLGLTGLGDDDHTLYTKADGTRPFSGVVAGITPTGGTHLATKSYVDAVGKGIDMKLACRAGTTAALPASTYDNGTLGVGATLTADANGALPAQDGISMAVANRFLVKNQAAAAENGIYKVTQLGDAGTPFIFTRVVDADEAAEVNAGMLTYIDEGTTQSDEQWVNINAVDTIGTDAQTFTKYGAGMSHDELADVSIDDHHARDHDLDAAVHGTCTKAELSGKVSDDTLLGELDVDDTPVNAATTAPVSSNWAYDHENDADQHPEYQKESERDAASGYMGLDAGSHGNSSPKHHDTTHENGGDDEMTLAGLDGEPATLTTHKDLDTGVHGAGASTLATAADIATHAGESDPHTGYRLESADHSHESTGLQAGKIDHGLALNGLTDNDHTQYILHSLATAANDFLVASGSGTFVKKTLAETGAILENDIDHGNIQGLSDDDHSQYHNDARAVTWHDADDHSGLVDDDLTWTGDHEINGELTADVVIGDGDYVGFQIPRTVGTGGITAGDLLKFDPSGLIVRRSGADDLIAGIAAAGAAASATGYYLPLGIAKALFTSGKEPSSAGENVFNDNTAGNYHKLTTDKQTDGIVYSFIAIETGALAKVIIIPRRIFSFEN